MDREQPMADQVGNVSAESIVKSAEDVGVGSQSKFKDVQSLEQAYSNLQSEFTRKCQKLSELEKENSKINNAEPLFKTEAWSGYVKEFLNINPNAKQFANQIMEVITKDKALAAMPNSLEIAYNKVLASKYKSESDLIADKDFLQNYVLNNAEIKQKIINDYVASLKQNQSPQVINTMHTSSVGLTPNKKAGSLTEAGEMAKKLFNK